MFSPQVRKIPWRRTWQPTPVFLPGESHGQRSPAGYSPWSHKELDTTEVTEYTCLQRHKWQSWDSRSGITDQKENLTDTHDCVIGLYSVT